MVDLKVGNEGFYCNITAIYNMPLKTLSFYSSPRLQNVVIV